MNEPKVVVAKHETAHGSVRSYTVGFGLSLVLTIAAFSLAVNKVYTGWSLVIALLLLAIVQLLVQLMFFLHLGRESRPRWNLWVLMFAVLVVLTVGLGSLWIMKNIQYNPQHGGLDPQQTDQFLIKDE